MNIRPVLFGLAVAAAHCGVPALTAKDVGTMTLTANQKNKCLLERDLVLEAKMSNGEVRRSGVESDKGIDLRKNVKIEASIGKVEIGGNQGERMWWTPPLLQSKLLEKGSVTVTAVMTDDPSKKAQLDFPIELQSGCQIEIRVGGENGQNGTPGMGSVDYCQGQENGGAGTNGGDGGTGGATRIEVIAQTHPKLGEVLVYRATNRAGVEERITRPDARVMIDGRGGDGGQGGEGGIGCNTGTACEAPGTAIAKVGNGGNAGNGGNGGAGSDVVVQLDAQHQDLKNKILVDVKGGKPGAAGAAGQAGDIHEKFCKARGTPGKAGQNGQPGRDGTIRLEVGGVAVADAGNSSSNPNPNPTPGGKETSNPTTGDRPAKTAVTKEAWAAAGVKGDFTIKIENRSSRELCSVTLGNLGNLVSGSPLAKGASAEVAHVGNPKPPPPNTRPNKLQVTATAKSCDGKLTGTAPVFLAFTDNTWIVYDGAAPKVTANYVSVIKVKE